MTMDTKTVTITGAQSKIGELFLHGDFPAESPVKATSLCSGSVKSLFLGGTGMGTTTALETEALDFCQWSEEHDENATILDLGGGVGTNRLTSNLSSSPSIETANIVPSDLPEWSPETTAVLSLTHPIEDSIAHRLRTISHALGYLSEIDGPVVLLLRDTWELVPARERKSPDERVSTLQEQLQLQLEDILRESRHQGLHLLAETQRITDIHHTVRDKFNRYAVFNASKVDVKDIFSYTCSDNAEAFYETLDPEAGRASIVGEVGYAKEQDHIEFLGPIDYESPEFEHE